MSQDIVTAIIKAPHSSQIKAKIKESSTAICSTYINPRGKGDKRGENTSQNTYIYLLIIP
jgi:hypothetical protein